MTCSNCGAQLKNGVAFCGICGASVIRMNSERDFASQGFHPDLNGIELEFSMHGQDDVSRKRLSKRAVALICAGAFAAAAAITLAVVFLFASKPVSFEQIAEDYVTAAINCDYEAVREMHAVDLDAALDASLKATGYDEEGINGVLNSDYQSTDAKAIIKTNLKEAKISEMKSTYGSETTLTVSFSKRRILTPQSASNKLSETELFLTELVKGTDYKYYDLLETSGIEEVSVTTLTMHYKSHKSTVKDIDVYCAKIDGRWLVVSDSMGLIDSFFTLIEKPEEVARKYVEAAVLNDLDTYLKYSFIDPEAYIKNPLLYSDPDIESPSLEQALKRADRFNKETVEKFRDMFGNDYVVTCSIGEMDIWEDDVKEYMFYLLDELFEDISELKLKQSDVIAIAQASVNIEIEGSRDSDAEYATLMIIQTKIGWKIFGTAYQESQYPFNYFNDINIDG